MRAELQFIEDKGVRPHPFMSRLTTNMHEDGHASDVTTDPGPAADSVVIDETYLDYFNDQGNGRLGMVPTLGYTSDGRIVAIGAKASVTTDWHVSRNLRRWAINLVAPGSVPVDVTFTAWKEFAVLLLNPETLAIESEVALPPVPATVRTIRVTPPTNPDLFMPIFDGRNAIWGWNEHKLYQDTSGGAYFTLDNEDRAIVPTRNEIWVVSFPGGDSPEVDRIPIGSLDPEDGLVSVVPAWMHRGVYWFASRHGKVGIASLSEGVIASYDIRTADGGDTEEVVNNSVSISHDGMYVVTSHALHCFDYSPSDFSLRRRWRTAYNRGALPQKCGQLPPLGSGTTPTLLGDRFVAFCDNDFDMNVQIVDRNDGTTTAIERVFPESSEIPAGHSACDNSVVAHKFRLFIGNTHCYQDPFEHNPTGGLSRIDIDPADGSSTRIWTAPDIAIWSAVPKYSSATDLLYIYARLEEGGQRWWHVRGVDADGNVQVSIPVHREEMAAGIDIPLRATIEVDRYDNGWGPLYIGQDTADSVAVMLGMTQGLYRVRFTK